MVLEVRMMCGLLRELGPPLLCKCGERMFVAMHNVLESVECTFNALELISEHARLDLHGYRIGTHNF